MSYWIFVINDGEATFLKRMREKTWPIFANTPNRSRIAVGDTIVFYLAGKRGQKFIGTATVASGLTRKNIDYVIELENTEVWENHVAVSGIKDDLNFIANKECWGAYFQGGVRTIFDHDYHLIVSKVRRRR